MSEKTDFDKIGVNVIRPFKSNGRWIFNYNNKKYDMAPAGIMDVVLSPLIIGADRLIEIGCQMKGISNPENGFNLLFSENYFPNADIKLNFKEIKHGGRIYSVEEINLKGIMPGQSAWLCPYMEFYYPQPPDVLYLKLEANDEF
jgi:hypothetical protein